MKKLTYKFVEKQFEKEDYILLSATYKNANRRLKYICPNGHQHRITWGDWQQGHRCPHCSNRAKLIISFIKKEFKKEGYKLLTKVYKNNSQKLNYICPNGHKHKISWANWRQGRRCPYCVGLTKLTIEFVRKAFEKEEYELLDKEYIGAHSKLNYICSNGHKHSIIWNAWQQGQRCPTCYHSNNFGKNHPRFGKGYLIVGQNNPNWKGGISCEPYCQDWTKEFKEYIKERDGYKCLNPDCWGNIHKLSVHHIDYNKKNCKPNNLITLCRSCNSRANKDRKWHKSWYKAIMNKRY